MMIGMSLVDVQPSLRDFAGAAHDVNPAMNRWATFGCPYGTLDGAEREAVPAMNRWATFGCPYGTLDSAERDICPGDESLGYCRASLRDCCALSLQG